MENRICFGCSKSCFFKELDFPLSEIQTILDDPGFDQVKSLQNHRRLLQKRAERMTHLLETIDKTIQRLTENNMKVTDEDLYAGFTQEQRERYEREVNEQYDPQLVQETNRRVRNMTKAQWRALQEEGEVINRGMADLMERGRRIRPFNPSSPAMMP